MVKSAAINLSKELYYIHCVKVKCVYTTSLNHDILYKPLFSRTVKFAFLDFCGNSRVVNFAIFLMLSLL